MELFFLAILVITMATALGSGFPVAFALPGSAIITIILAGISGFIFNGDSSAFFHQGGPFQWISSGVTNLRGVYWEVERDTLIAIPLFIFMGIMLQKSKTELRKLWVSLILVLLQKISISLEHEQNLLQLKLF